MIRVLTSGSHINIEGVMQSFAAAVSAPSESKPAWKVLKVLADLLELRYCPPSLTSSFFAVALFIDALCI
jgi:NADH dehydrogenase/NADH:ubiquinone oxidoreductase subunit G